MEHELRVIVDLAQSIGIIGLLSFTIYQIRQSTKVTKQNVKFNILQASRDISSLALNHPDKIKRISQKEGTITTIDDNEERFCAIQVAHWLYLEEADQNGFFTFDVAYKKSIKEFLSRPVPKKFWQDNKQYYPEYFRKFIDKIIETNFS